MKAYNLQSKLVCHCFSTFLQSSNAFLSKQVIQKLSKLSLSSISALPQKRLKDRFSVTQLIYQLMHLYKIYILKH